MGLDMYAYAVKKGVIKSETFNSVSDFLADEGRIDEEEVGYWRKFNHLHGWFEQLYREKGGKRESFNCVCVTVNLDDLEKLQKDAINGLTPTEGFFFGSQREFELEDLIVVLEFIVKTKRWIEDGYDVYYTSWW